MLLADAEALTLKLMREFKLIDDSQHNYDPDWQNWTFEFDDAKRRFGCCHRSWTRRYLGTGKYEFVAKPGGKITLSRELVLRNDLAKVEDVIRHEIAHALCQPKAGHGPKWKKMCKVTGANPKRCYDEEVDTPEATYIATCAVCSTDYHRFKLPRGDRWCSNKECKRRLLPYVAGQESGFHPMRKLVWRHKNAPVPKAEDKRAAIEAMKAQLRKEQGNE